MSREINKDSGDTGIINEIPEIYCLWIEGIEYINPGIQLGSLTPGKFVRVKNCLCQGKPVPDFEGIVPEGVKKFQVSPGKFEFLDVEENIVPPIPATSLN